MNSAIVIAINIASDTQAASRPCHLAPEKVGLWRIRLSWTRRCLGASVGTFFAADKVLLSWAMRNQGPLECEVEIVYDDGHTLAGEYRFQRRLTSRPALMAFVRKTLGTLCEGRGWGGAVRGLVKGPHSFLAHYETEDFTSN